MPSRILTPAGNWPPSCRYLCTTSRPVKTTPEITTSSRAFKARIFDSVKGDESWIIRIERSVGGMECRRPGPAARRSRVRYSSTSSSVKPLHNFALPVQRHAQPAIRPAHVTDAHEIGRRQTIDRANLHAQQSRFAPEAHRPNAQRVRRFQYVL